MRRTPALIVGGGPAGAATALHLARAGRPHLLLERRRETGDALCGGFLSWRTLRTLGELGVSQEELNRNVVTSLRLIAGERVVEARLPGPAIGVSRRRLDSLLLARAEAAGAAVERGVSVRSVEGLTATTSDAEVLAAGALFLASGKHDVRGLARPEAARGEDPAIGLRVRLPPVPALRRMLVGAIELHLFDRGYAGLVLHEDGGANMCLATHRSRLHGAGSPSTLLRELAAESPHLGERLAFAPSDVTIDAVANVPYGWRARTGQPGLFRLGDQAAVIPSLAGEGMGIALASAASAAHAYLRYGPDGARHWQRRFARKTAMPLAIAGLVQGTAKSRLAPILVSAARTPKLIEIVARATRMAHATP